MECLSNLTLKQIKDYCNKKGCSLEILVSSDCNRIVFDMIDKDGKFTRTTEETINLAKIKKIF